MEYLNIMFKPTKQVFKLSKEKCLEIISEDKERNYKILDEGFEEISEQEEIQTSTYNQVVIESSENNKTPEEIEEEKQNLIIKYKEFTVPQLKTYMSENNIEFDKSDKKDDLIIKIVETEINKA